MVSKAPPKNIVNLNENLETMNQFLEKQKNLLEKNKSVYTTLYIKIFLTIYFFFFLLSKIQEHFKHVTEEFN